MRRMNLALVLLLVVGVTLLGVVAPVVAGQKGAAKGAAPQADGRFRMITTSISPSMGVSWADGELSFNNQVYKFTVEAKTYTESQVLTNLAGGQVAFEGMVFNLKKVADFAGTFTHIKPEAVKAMGGTGRNPAFQNDKGVAIVVTRKANLEPGIYVSLVGDSFKVTMKDF
jgi:hypothetical protein